MYVASDITKHYGGVTALNHVDFELRRGEVHALLGANGAGKSTLVRILVGAERPDSGGLSLANKVVRLGSVSEARRRGIAIVSQELNVFPDLDVLENLFVLREPRRLHTLLRRREMARIAAPALTAIGLDVPLSSKVGALSLGERQLVEIARALLDSPGILILDEPTSALQLEETERLLNAVRMLRDRGVAIVYVSHLLQEVFSIADCITVLRGGRVALSRHRVEESSITAVIREMLGEAANETRSIPSDTPLPTGRNVRGSLRLRGAAITGVLDALDLDVGPGEVVGLAGLEGSGAASVLDVVFGRRRLDSGSISLPDAARPARSMEDAVRKGVAFVPADRKRLGLMLDKPVSENIALVVAGPLRRMGMFLRRSRLEARTEFWRKRLDIKMASSKAVARSLSGGNQQKVVFAKWLESEPSVILLDDPCRGVDVGARVAVHRLIRSIAREGCIILMVSSDPEELPTVCDRVIVFVNGSATAEVSGDNLTEHVLLEAISARPVNQDN